jgi:hypothetical protein
MSAAELGELAAFVVGTWAIGSAITIAIDWISQRTLIPSSPRGEKSATHLNPSRRRHRIMNASKTVEPERVWDSTLDDVITAFETAQAESNEAWSLAEAAREEADRLERLAEALGLRRCECASTLRSHLAKFDGKAVMRDGKLYTEATLEEDEVPRVVRLALT